MDPPDGNRSDQSPPDDRPAPNAAKTFFPDFATVRAVLEAGHIGIWSWDVGSGRVIWSSNLEAIHGVPAGSFQGTYADFEHDIHRDDWPPVTATLKEALRTHSAYRTRYRTSPREGRDDCWLEASGTVAVKDGVAERMQGLCHDVTETVNLENELRSRIRQQEALAQLGERALAEPDLDRLLNDAVSTVALTLSVDFVKVLELLPGDTDLLLRGGFWLEDRRRWLGLGIDRARHLCAFYARLRGPCRHRGFRRGDAIFDRDISERP